MTRAFRRYRPGTKIAAGLSIVSTIAETDGRHPVYLAWDHKLWAPVACKVFRNTRRAEREHKLLTSLAHPNIIRALDVYEPAMMSMEYLQGPTLADYVPDVPEVKRMSVSDVIRAICHVGSALQHVHQRGYMHLDVKPGNVILNNGRPILFDFGTARRIGEERPSTRQGTDAYMPPEECRLQDVGPAADVFSLGVTLFELLTGELPFVATRKRDLLPQLTQEPIKLRKLRPSLPRALETLVDSCLRHDPAERPVLTKLLPGLQNFISGGAPMWPATVTP
ncbi:MAG: serine/threonine protein kinase [Alphaproteobacteria bacterium]|nr:serine/threonine protein kinase [Alphaproteobacteria bacterium]